MTTLVITVAGQDRPGLVSRLADIITEHDGSWGRSQLSELAGTFAGVITVEVPRDGAEQLAAALDGLQGVLETSVRWADDDRPVPAVEGPVIQLDLVGHDQPGIVSQVSGVLADHGVSVESLETEVAAAAQSGGQLFFAKAVLRVGHGSDLGALRAALEDLAQELQVDLSLDEEGRGEDRS